MIEEYKTKSLLKSFTGRQRMHMNTFSAVLSLSTTRNSEKMIEYNK